MAAIPQGGPDYATQVAIGAPGGIVVTGQATVGASAVLVRASNPKVKSRVFVNNGPGSLYPGPDNTVSVGNTIPVPSGGTLVLDNSNGNLYFIASQAGTDLRFLEETNA